MKRSTLKKMLDEKTGVYGKRTWIIGKKQLRSLVWVNPGEKFRLLGCAVELSDEEDKLELRIT